MRTWLPAVAVCMALVFVDPAAGQEPRPSPDTAELLRRLQLVEAELRALKLLPPEPSLNLPDLSEKQKPRYPSVNVGGVFQADVGWFSQSTANRLSVGDLEDGANFRRARLHAFGALAEQMDYRLQMDFAFFGRPSFTDVYFDVKQIPGLGNIRVGQWKQWVGLEEITSFRFNPFFERASIFLFNPFRRIGIGTYDWSADEKFTWQTSIFRAGQDQFGGDIGDNNGWGGTLRGTANPIYDHDGAEVLHLGVAYHPQFPTDQRLRFGAFGGNSPEFGLFVGQPGTASFRGTPSFVDTGVLLANTNHLLGGEFAWVRGPFSVQAEANVEFVDQVREGPLWFWGGYLYATWFLTGEHRVYNRRFGSFDQIRPRANFNPWSDGNWRGGALELAARLSYIDLTDGQVQGGTLTDVTLSVNWYLNTNVRLSFNYIHAMLNRPPHGQSHADIFALRAQVEW